MGLIVDIKLRNKEFCLCFKTKIETGITGLFGPSGSGKTTLLHCIAGLTKPDSGHISLNNDVLFNSNLQCCTPARKRRIGLVFQGHLLFPHLTVTGNLSYGQKGNRSKKRKKLYEIAELMDIASLLSRKIHRLSGGEKQRVALARAILSDPQMLLLDEPFGGQDNERKMQIRLYLKKLHESTKIPMILVSHDAQDMIELAHELIFIENGKNIAQGALSRRLTTYSKQACLCNSQKPGSSHNMRNILVKTHGMKFPLAN